MTIEVSGTMFGILMGALFLLVIGIILAAKYYLRNKTVEELSSKHREDITPTVASRVKYPEVNNFRVTGPVFLFGLASAVLVALLALSWTEYEKPVYIPDDAMLLDEEIEIEPPRTAEPPPPPPPPPPPVIEEVPEEEILEEEEPEFLDQSIEEETVIEEKPEPVIEAPPPPPPPPEPEVEEIFKVVEQMPRFPGCENIGGNNDEKAACAQQKLLEYIYKNIKYPAIARENGIQGRVVVRFVVEKDGSVSESEILRDIGAGTGQEALRVVESMNSMPQKWTPGKQRGKPVKVYFTLPVQFKLE